MPAFEGDRVSYRGVDTKGEILAYFSEVVVAENVSAVGW